MNLSKEQIAEISEVLEGKFERGTTIPDFVELLTEKFGAKEEWPHEGNTYFSVSGHGEIHEINMVNDSWDKGCIEIGNIYRTKEEAEARVNLVKHIQKFKVSESDSGWWFYREINKEKGFALEENGYVWGIEEKANFYAGLIMPLSSTEKDRAERIDLLKKCFS